MFGTHKLVSVILTLAVLLVVAPLAAAQMDGSVTVVDQEIVGDTVVVANVVSPGPGWMVIHADQDGAPGPVVGYAPVVQGENVDVAVNIDRTMATETMYAMLHTDAGQEGVYEFPGDDAPVAVDGQPVTSAFRITAGLDTEAGVMAEAGPADQEMAEEAAPEAGAAVEPPPASPPPVLPATGGAIFPWAAVLAALAGGVFLLGGLALARRVR